jgi:hypothetical protein
MRLYLGITLACAALAVLAHFLFEAPGAVRSYAEGQMESAVRDAVREEVRSAAAEQNR